MEVLLKLNSVEIVAKPQSQHRYSNEKKINAKKHFLERGKSPEIVPSPKSPHQISTQ
jgi:hypothetical protein